VEQPNHDGIFDYLFECPGGFFANCQPITSAGIDYWDHERNINMDAQT